MEGSPCLHPCGKLRGIRGRRIIIPPESVTDGMGEDGRDELRTRDAPERRQLIFCLVLWFLWFIRLVWFNQINM